uniref:Uncharacterized protein n=1 Tax=Chelonoidis abingdonii TaxID=106734 RepID=A0A8C0IKR1_CHEAB
HHRYSAMTAVLLLSSRSVDLPGPLECRSIRMTAVRLACQDSSSSCEAVTTQCYGQHNGHVLHEKTWQEHGPLPLSEGHPSLALCIATR